MHPTNQGSQAIKALKEENVETILVNPNIATVQTGDDLADVVYFLPIRPEYIEYVIQQEKPDAILLTFGGQSALNCGIELHNSGVLAKYNVKVLGTPIQTLVVSEDRDLFAKALKEIDIPCATSIAVETVQDALNAAKEIGYPVIIRSAYALGGLGSGFAENPKELQHLATQSLSLSPQILVERSMKGWKEVEYEVVRDAENNCITVCNMENFDPLGTHTGDSIVVAPSQTLSDQEYHMLRTAAIKIIRHLGVVGECNVQYGLHPTSLEYVVIEVNARLSRSSALASKATGYPLASVAAKIALGATLPELKNAVTKTTTANFEPSLDYVVTKIPRWDLSKFQHVSRNIGSAMKSVGEVMAIGRTWEESLQKAIRMVDPMYDGFQGVEFENLDKALSEPTDRRLFAVGSAMINHGYSVDRIHDLTKIDKWFLYKLENIFNVKKDLASFAKDKQNAVGALSKDQFALAKRNGFSDIQIAQLVGSNEMQVRSARKAHGVIPFVKRIDTLAAEFPASTNYLYTTYGASSNDVTFEDSGIMVLGSGVYRIGSSVEFDWCGVSCIRTLRDLKYKTIMVNYNPETVSTDFDECDRLYFEELSMERVMDIYELESASGCVVSVGGQLPQNIALKLHENGLKILGTSPVDVDCAENREKFSRILDDAGIDQPEWRELSTVQEAIDFANRVSFPVLVRPSYVLSGAAMNVAYSEKDLIGYLALATDVSPDHPIVITKFIQGAQELDIDAVGLNGKLELYAVSQHIENAGVHSGDATLVLPPLFEDETQGSQWNGKPVGMKGITKEIVADCKTIAEKVAKAFNITGPFNMQIILSRENGVHTLKVIECNIRASRSFPFVSKVLGKNFIEVATRALVGAPLDLPKDDIMLIERPYKAVKSPIFSWTRLAGADPMLGVEMASTGEVACFGRDIKEAFATSLFSNHNNFSKFPMSSGSGVLVSLDELSDPNEACYVASKLQQMKYKVIVDDKLTADILTKGGVKDFTMFSSEPLETLLPNRHKTNKHYDDHNIEMMMSLGKIRPRTPNSKYRLRRTSIDLAKGFINDSKNAVLFVDALMNYSNKTRQKSEAVKSVHDWIQ